MSTIFMNSVLNPIIFIGPGRSGSTIVSNTLMNHKKLGFPSNYQQKFPDQPVVNLLKRMFDNQIWRLTNNNSTPSFFRKFLFFPSECYAMWNYITREEINFSRDFLYNVKPTHQEVKYIRNYFKKMLHYQGKERLSFKITGPARISYLNDIFPQAQFVYVKRRTIPTINSFLKVGFWQARGAHQLWWRGVYTKEDLKWVEANQNRPELITAFQLKKIDEMADREISENHPDVIVSYYENFAKEPDQEIQRLKHHLGLKHDKACYNFMDEMNITYRDQKDEDYFDISTLEDIYQIINN